MPAIVLDDESPHRQRRRRQCQQQHGHQPNAIPVYITASSAISGTIEVAICQTAMRGDASSNCATVARNPPCYVLPSADCLLPS